MDKQERDKFIRIFKKTVRKIFRDNIEFTFLCGGFSRNQLAKSSDIDMFICLKNKSGRRQLQKFHDWYFKIHRKYRLKPDTKYPGEIISIKKLDACLRLTQKSKPKKIITKQPIYDGIVWAGMLSGSYKVFAGNKDKFLKRRKLAKQIVNFWGDKIIKRGKSKLTSRDQMLKKLIIFKE